METLRGKATALVNLDPMGRVTALRTLGGLVLTYVFDDQGRLSQTRFGDGRTVRYQYDDAGLLAALTLPSGQVRRYRLVGDECPVCPWALGHAREVGRGVLQGGSILLDRVSWTRG